MAGEGLYGANGTSTVQRMFVVLKDGSELAAGGRPTRRLPRPGAHLRRRSRPRWAGRPRRGPNRWVPQRDSLSRQPHSATGWLPQPACILTLKSARSEVLPLQESTGITSPPRSTRSSRRGQFDVGPGDRESLRHAVPMPCRIHYFSKVIHISPSSDPKSSTGKASCRYSGWAPG